MNNSRRKFLKLTGLTVLGITAEKFIDVRAKETKHGPSTPAGDSAKGVKKIDEVKSVPLKKERLAMVVDLRKCKEGCTKCIDECNKIHNIPDFGEPKDAIKWIWKEPYGGAFIDEENFYMKEEYRNKMVPVLCNNCNNPPCVEVCPTQATFQREDGIVMMDWHRCIGCRYCMAACPYGSRSFNWRDPRPFIKDVNPDFPTRMRGVVEKCIWCEERLAEGLPPACVEVCPEKALVFGNLNDPESDVRKLLKENFSVKRKPGLGTNPEVYYLV